MKVCLLNDAFPPVIDGVVNVIMNYADYMMKDFGAEIEVGTPRYPDADYSAYPYKVVPYASFDTSAVTNGYRAGNPFEGKAVSELVDFDPDIIHAHCPAAALVVARILRETTGAPLVFTYHTKYDIDIRRAVKVEAVAREGIRAMVSNIEACDEVWVVSDGAGKSLKALGFRGKYHVVHNGVDFEKGRVDPETVKKVTSAYDLPEGLPVFLFVGRMMCYKGIPMILDALKILSDSGMDFRMLFIGKGPDRETLEEQARELGLLGGDGSAPKCIFVGPVYDRDELRAWNSRADLFLFPSTFDTNGLVVREAAACGLASVLIRDSCAAEGITDKRNGFIIDETPEAMAELLKSVSREPDRMREVGQHAMDELYISWETSVARAYARYENILARKQKGILPHRRKQATDLLVSWTARNMEEQEKLRRFGREIMGDFRESAVGMMENIQDVEDRSETFWNNFAKEMRNTTDKMRADVLAEREAAARKMQELRADARSERKAASRKIHKLRREAEAEREAAVQRMQKISEEAKTGIEAAADKMRSGMETAAIKLRGEEKEG